ncbi:Rho guanine nucleotide exchange factor (GEF) 17 [Balamuthia mandrillaris]
MLSTGAVGGKDKTKDNQHARRTEIVEEILASERIYVTHLTVLVEMTGLVKAEDIQKLFANSEQLLSINSELLWALEERVRHWSETRRIADVFLNLTPFLKMYDLYYGNYDSAVETLEALEQNNEGFQQFLQEQHQIPECRSLTLMSRLILPIQRLPRYQLLLQTLADHTERYHPDFDNICKAAELMREVAERIDQNLKVIENKNKVYEVQKRLTGCPNLTATHRSLLKEGVVLKVTSRWVVNCTLFLFSDIIVYSHRSLKSFSQLNYKGLVPLPMMWIRNLQDTDELKNAFQIVSITKTYTIFTKTNEEKEDWIQAIHQALDQYLESNPQYKAHRSSVKVNNPKGLWKLFSKDVSRAKSIHIGAYLDGSREEEDEEAEEEDSSPLSEEVQALLASPAAQLIRKSQQQTQLNQSPQANPFMTLRGRTTKKSDGRQLITVSPSGSPPLPTAAEESSLNKSSKISSARIKKKWGRNSSQHSKKKSDGSSPRARTSETEASGIDVTGAQDTQHTAPGENSPTITPAIIESIIGGNTGGGGSRRGRKKKGTSSALEAHFKELASLSPGEWLVATNLVPGTKAVPHQQLPTSYNSSTCVAAPSSFELKEVPNNNIPATNISNNFNSSAPRPVQNYNKPEQPLLKECIIHNNASNITASSSGGRFRPGPFEHFSSMPTLPIPVSTSSLAAKSKSNTPIQTTASGEAVRPSRFASSSQPPPLRPSYQYSATMRPKPLAASGDAAHSTQFGTASHPGLKVRPKVPPRTFRPRKSPSPWEDSPDSVTSHTLPVPTPSCVTVNQHNTQPPHLPHMQPATQPRPQPPQVRLRTVQPGNGAGSPSSTSQPTPSLASPNKGNRTDNKNNALLSPHGAEGGNSAFRPRSQSSEAIQPTAAMPLSQPQQQDSVRQRPSPELQPRRINRPLPAPPQRNGPASPTATGTSPIASTQLAPGWPIRSNTNKA